MPSGRGLTQLIRMRSLIGSSAGSHCPSLAASGQVHAWLGTAIKESLPQPAQMAGLDSSETSGVATTHQPPAAPWSVARQMSVGVCRLCLHANQYMHGLTSATKAVSSHSAFVPIPAVPSEETLKFQHAEQVIAVLGDVLSSTRPFADLLEQITERATDLTGATGAVVELVDGAELQYVSVSGSAMPFKGMRLSVAGSLSGLCVQSGQLQYAADTDDDPRVDQEACRKIGARSMMIVPLVHDSSALGVLKVISDRPHTFG